MSTADVARGLVSKVKQGDYEGAMAAYYHQNIISIEAAGEPREVVGIGECRKKAEWWTETFEVHGAEIEGPFIGDRQFSVRYNYDVTNKATGQRHPMDEMALYWVDGGKIVREQFFYHMPGM